VAPEDTLAVAEDIGRAGIGRLWISEDYFRRGAFSTAGAILARVPDLEVGLGITSPFVRHPAVLAMEIATLVEMFPGRFISGIGSGNVRSLSRMRLRPEKIIGAVGRGFDVVRDLLAGERITRSGAEAGLEDVLLEYPTRSMPMMYMAASSTQMLRLAVGRADGLILSILSSPGYIRSVIAQVRDEGKRGDFPVTAFLYIAGSAAPADDETARGFLASRLKERASTSPLLTKSLVWPQLEPLLSLGVDDLAEQLPAECVAEFIVGGTEEAVRETVESLGEIGVSDIAFCPVPDAEGKVDYTRLISLLASP
jgi:alkanesulfonate monooxygenase SsuD/methylene tetrahydromethanopterin reductase-like flavin-dependent oxidoreductase (luciferase family)